MMEKRKSQVSEYKIFRKIYGYTNGGSKQCKKLTSWITQVT